MTEGLHYDLATAGFAFAISQAVAIPTRIFWGWIGSRFCSPRTMLGALGVGMAAASIAMGLTDGSWHLAEPTAVACAPTAPLLSWDERKSAERGKGGYGR